nr:hypothetical protein [Tanacetum cinerariifolium]
MFDRSYKRVNTFEDIKIELLKEKEKRAGEELVQESTKKQKVEDNKEKAELKQLMETIPYKKEVAIDDIPLAILVPSCFVIFDFEPLSLPFNFVILSEIIKSLSFNLDRLCHLTILCLDQHAHTLHHLESLLTISLDRLDILKKDLVYQSLQKSLSLILELS